MAVGASDGVAAVVTVATGTGVGLWLLLWQVLHAENGMLSWVTVLVVVTTLAVGFGQAVALAVAEAIGIGRASTATSGSMIVNVWLPPSCTEPRL